MVLKLPLKQPLINVESITFKGAGTVVRDRREAAGLKLHELAEQVGVNKSTLQRWETDNAPLTNVTIEAIADALKLDAIRLLTDCLLYVRP